MKTAVVAILICLRAAMLFAGEVHVVPEFRGVPLKAEELAYVTDDGQTMEISRLDFLVSELALLREDDTWEAATERAAFCSLAKGQMRVATGAFPGRYKALRFL